MIEVRQTDELADWMAGLRDRNAKAKINVRIRRLSLGLLGDVKPVDQGVRELRVDYGPGYRSTSSSAGLCSQSCFAAATSAPGSKTSRGR